MTVPATIPRPRTIEQRCMSVLQSLDFPASVFVADQEFENDVREIVKEVMRLRRQVAP